MRDLSHIIAAVWSDGLQQVLPVLSGLIRFIAGLCVDFFARRSDCFGCYVV